MMSSRSTDPDIVVTGTGIAGLACALALGRKGLRAGLLGPRAPLAPAGDVFDARVYALSPASRQVLAELGVWDMLPAARIAPVRAMEVFGDGRGRVGLSAWQGGADAMAWIVESVEIERALRQAVQWFGLPWIEDGFAALEHGDDGRPVLTTQGGRRLAPALAVAADGAASSLRRAAGLEARRSDYGEMGVVAHLDAELPHQGYACQWFGSDRTLALLPMPDTAAGAQLSMVWSMPSADARALSALPQEGQSAWLATQLAQATGGRFGALRLRGEVAGFELALQRCPHWSAGGVVLVGDAAHVVHPLAGQGLNLGLGDVRALAQVLGGREPFRALGDPRLLRRYQRARVEAVTAMAVMTDGLHRLFASPAAPAGWLRNAGMDVVDRLPWLKRRLIDGASGA